MRTAERNFLLVTPFFPDGMPTNGGNQRIAAFRLELLKYGNVYTCVPNKKDADCSCVSRELGLYRIPGRVLMRRHPVRHIVNRLHKFFVGWLESWENAKTAPFATELPLDEWFPGVRFDAIFLRTFEEVRLFRPWNLGIPVFVDLDDSPLEAFDTRFGPRLAAWRRALSRALFAAKFRKYCSRCAGGWLANDENIGVLGLPRDRFLCMPNHPVPPPPAYRPETECRDSLLFVGSFGYVPNIEAMTNFLNDIWPDISKAHPGLTLRIVGGGVPLREKARWERVGNVAVVGFAADLSPFYERAYATVVPMLSGSGTAIKTMESLAYQRVCLASPFGARGWRAGAVGICVCDSPESWVHAVTDVMNISAADRRKLEKEARATLDKAGLKEQAAAAVHALVDRLEEKAHMGEAGEGSVS